MGVWQGHVTNQKNSPDRFAFPQDRELVTKGRVGSPAHAQGKSQSKNESPSKEKLRVRKERSPDSVSEPERGHRKTIFRRGRHSKHAGAPPPYLDVEEEAWHTAAEQLSEYEQSHEWNWQQESLGHPLGPAPGNDSSQPSCYPYDHSIGSIVPPGTRLDNHHLAGEPGDGSHATYIPPHHHQPAVGSVDGAYPAYPWAQDPRMSMKGRVALMTCPPPMMRVNGEGNMKMNSTPITQNTRTPSRRIWPRKMRRKPKNFALFYLRSTKVFGTTSNF